MISYFPRPGHHPNSHVFYQIKREDPSGVREYPRQERWHKEVGAKIARFGCPACGAEDTLDCLSDPDYRNYKVFPLEAHDYCLIKCMRCRRKMFVYCLRGACVDFSELPRKPEFGIAKGSRFITAFRGSSYVMVLGEGRELKPLWEYQRHKLTYDVQKDFKRIEPGLKIDLYKVFEAAMGTAYSVDMTWAVYYCRKCFRVAECQLERVVHSIEGMQKKTRLVECPECGISLPFPLNENFTEDSSHLGWAFVMKVVPEVRDRYMTREYILQRESHSHWNFLSYNTYISKLSKMRKVSPDGINYNPVALFEDVFPGERGSFAEFFQMQPTGIPSGYSTALRGVLDRSARRGPSADRITIESTPMGYDNPYRKLMEQSGNAQPSINHINIRREVDLSHIDEED